MEEKDNTEENIKIGSIRQGLLERNKKAFNSGNIGIEAKGLADTIVMDVPIGREQSLALTRLEEVVFWANKANFPSG